MSHLFLPDSFGQALPIGLISVATLLGIYWLHGYRRLPVTLLSIYGGTVSVVLFIRSAIWFVIHPLSATRTEALICWFVAAALMVGALAALVRWDLRFRWIAAPLIIGVWLMARGLVWVAQ